MTTLADVIEVLRLAYVRGFASSEDKDRIVWHAEHAALDRVIEILSPLAVLSDADVAAMITQTSNLATSWASASDCALTDAEHDRCGAIASGYAALAASLTALRGQR